MPWKEDELHFLLNCKTPAQAFGVLKEESVRLGMSNVAIGLVMPLPLDEPKFILFNDYSDRWRQYYAEHHLIEADPTVKHGLRSVLPVLWTDQELHAQGTESFWEEARAVGLQYGIAQPVWDRQGCCSMLSFSRSHLDFSQTELHEKLPKIAWLAQLAHATLSSMLVVKEVPQSQVSLTAREKELLRWTAAGLSSTQIADKLNLSSRTMDWHFINACGKLGVTHRSQAAFIAYKLGLIDR